MGSPELFFDPQIVAALVGSTSAFALSVAIIFITKHFDEKKSTLEHGRRQLALLVSLEIESRQNASFASAMAEKAEKWAKISPQDRAYYGPYVPTAINEIFFMSAIGNPDLGEHHDSELISQLLNAYSGLVIMKNFEQIMVQETASGDPKRIAAVIALFASQKEAFSSMALLMNDLNQTIREKIEQKSLLGIQ